MGLFPLIGTLFATIGAGVVAADLTPGIRGVGPAAFALVGLLVFAIHHVATRKAK